MLDNSNKTRIWNPSLENIEKCGQLLKKGDLVSFPTETVYGLGANALNKNAILNIFLTKKRPLTDPLIVHIYKKDMSYNFLNLNSTEKEVFNLLTDEFWPGPLTIVGRAHSSVLPELCANTGFVGVRYPQHELALKLLEYSQVPVAAPSANLFGHVSPTKAEHVFKDFENSNIDILDGGSTSFGIESTVIKLDSQEKNGNIIVNLHIFRRGSISLKMINNFCEKFYLEKNKKIKVFDKKHIVSEDIDTQSPGQFLKHYSPDKPAFILKKANGCNQLGKDNNILNLEKSILIDFGNSFKDIKNIVGTYKDLSSEGNLREAMKNYYSFLREVEDLEERDFIIICDLLDNKEKIKSNEDFVYTLQDKIFRSCEGKFVIVSEVSSSNGISSSKSGNILDKDLKNQQKIVLISS